MRAVFASCLSVFHPRKPRMDGRRWIPIVRGMFIAMTGPVSYEHWKCTKLQELESARCR